MSKKGFGGNQRAKRLKRLKGLLEEEVKATIIESSGTRVVKDTVIFVENQGYILCKNKIRLPLKYCSFNPDSPGEITVNLSSWNHNPHYSGGAGR